MRRAAFIAALLAASVASGRELPVQRDYVRPMEFGDAEVTAVDLRAAPDVAMQIERREEFARERKTGKKGLLALGEKRASGGAGAYYGDATDDGEARKKDKKDDWLVKSVTQGAFGNTNGSQSVVQSVLGKDSEESAESKWGWLAEEMEQRQNEEAAQGPAEEDVASVEGLRAETPEEAMLIQQAMGREDEAKKPDSMAEQDAKRDEIRNAPAQEEPVAFSAMQKNLDDIREKLALNTPGAAGADAKPAAASETAGGARDWSQPLLGNEPMKVTRLPESAGVDFHGSGERMGGGGNIGDDRPSAGGGFGYERPDAGGFGLPSAGGGAGTAARVEMPAWGAAGGTTHGGVWSASSGGGSGWSALPVPGAGGASGWNTGGGDRGNYTTTRPDPARIGTPGGGTLMPW